MRLTYFRAGQKNEVEAKLSEQDEAIFGYKLDVKGARAWRLSAHFRASERFFDVQKRAVIIDKDGKVLTTTPDEKIDKIERLYKEALSPDQMKKFEVQIDAVQKQVKIAQERAAEAIEQATKAVQKAAEAARIEIEKARERSEAAEKKDAKKD